MQFASEPTNSIGFHRIIRRNGNLFGVSTFGAVERAKLKSCGPRRGARKLHACAAFWAAELLNCEQWDCGWVICHCIPPCFRRERNALSHRLKPKGGGGWVSRFPLSPLGVFRKS